MSLLSPRSLSTGLSNRAKRAAKAGKDRLRHLALDTLEPRTLMSVLPPPQVLTRTDVSNTPNSQDTAPSISVDPLDPLRAVAVWTRNTGNDIPGQYNFLGEGSYTTDGGQNWTKFSSNKVGTYTYSLPSPLPDPAQGKPTQTSQYTDTTDVSVAFDRQHNVFILESQHNSTYLSGALVLQKYDFHTATPNPTLTNKIVHQWFDPNGDQADQAHNATLAVDTGVGTSATNQPAGSPTGIILGPDGNTYVAIQDANQVQQFDGNTGQYDSVFASGNGLYQPNDITFNPQDGDFYISNRQNAQVLRVDGTTGGNLGTFTQGLVTPKTPRDMVISPVDGNLYVSSKETGSILRYNSGTGAFLGSFIAPHSGGLQQPEGIAFGSDNNLYVADANNDTVLRYNGTTGAFIDVFVSVPQNGGLDGPRGLVFGPDRNLYIVSQNTNQVLRYDRNTGNFLSSFALASTDPLHVLNLPTSLAFSPIDGNLLVTSFTPGNPTATPPIPDTSEILRYNGATGVYISSFLAPPAGGLDQPVGIAFRLNGPSGHNEILVGSFKTDSILRFDATTGVYIDTFDVKKNIIQTFVGKGSGGLDGPSGFTFAPDGSLYVSSENSNAILHYKGQDGAFLNSITPEPLNAPQDAILGPDGYLYAASRDTDSIARFDATSGKFLGNFVASGAGGLNRPSGLVFSPDGSYLLVASSYDTSLGVATGGASILKYNAQTGAYLGDFVTAAQAAIDRLGDPEGLVFKGNDLYVTSNRTVIDAVTRVESKLAGVIKYSMTAGGIILGSGLYTPEPLLAPEGAVMSPIDGNLLVISGNSNEILKYDGTTGKFLSIFVTGDPATNGGLLLSNPRDLVFQGGSLYVTYFGGSYDLGGASKLNTGDVVVKYNGSTGDYQGLFTPEPQRNPTAEAWDAAGNNLYVASFDSNEVLQYDKTGKFVKIFVGPDVTKNGGLVSPNGVAVDSSGNVYVSSFGTNQILKYSAAGAVLGVFADPKAATNPVPVGHLNGPHTLAIDSANNLLYVACSNTDSVEKYDLSGGNVSTGHYISDAAAPGQGGLNGPEGLVIDSAGQLYVASFFTSTVIRYASGVSAVVVPSTAGVTEPSGLALTEFTDNKSQLHRVLYIADALTNRVVTFDVNSPPVKLAPDFVYHGYDGLDNPTALTLKVSPGDPTPYLYVLSANTGQVLKYDGTLGTSTSGQLPFNNTTQQFVTVFTPPTLDAPTGLSFDANGQNLFVGGSGTGRIFHYDATGAFVGYTDPEPLRKPEDMVIHSVLVNNVLTPFLYVASEAKNEIIRYDATSGAFAGVFVVQGTGGLDAPKGLAFDSAGNLYVVSRGTKQILEFDASGRFLKAFIDGNVNPASSPIGADGILFDSAGNLLVADFAANVVLRYDSKGAPLPINPLPANQPPADFVPTTVGLAGPTGMAIDSATSTLYVASQGNNSVYAFNATSGAPINQFVSNTNANGLTKPIRIAVDTIQVAGVSTTVLDVVSQDQNAVYRYRLSDGKFIDKVVPSGLAGLSGAFGIALDNANGSMLIASENTDGILRFDGRGSTPATGGSLFTPQSLGSPEDVLSDPKAPGVILVSDSKSNDVVYYDSTGSQYLGIFIPAGAGAGNGVLGLSKPQSLFIDPVSGNLFVTNLTDNSVYSFHYVDSNGNFQPLPTTTVPGNPPTINVNTLIGGQLVRPGAGGLKDPQGLVLDTNTGNLLVASRATDIVLSFDPNQGTYVNEFTPEPLINPTGLTFNKTTGELIVASQGSDRALLYDDTGGYLRKFSSDDQANPEGTVVDAAGNLYVASRDNNEVLRYNPDGTFKDIFIPQALGGLNGPTGLVFGKDGNLYVSSSRSNEILRYTAAGAFIGVFVPFITGSPANALNPRGLAVDATGNIYVASGSQVQEYRAGSGAFLKTFVLAGGGGLAQAVGIGFADTNNDGTQEFYVSSFGTSQVLQYNASTGVFVKIYANTATSASNNLSNPTYFSFATDNTLYVSSSGNNEVIRYQAATGAFLDVFVSPRRGGLSNPQGIAFEPGKLLVASADTGQVLSYSITTGAYTSPFTPGPLIAPTRVVYGPDGKVYISSAGTDSVLQYALAPVVVGNVITKYHVGRLVSDYVAADSGVLTAPNGLVFTPDGSLLVASEGSDDIIRYKPNSGLVNDSFQPVRPDSPTFEAISPIDGLLYVSSTDSNSILRYDPATGRLLGVFVGPDSGGLSRKLIYDPTTGRLVSNVLTPTFEGLNRPEGLAFDKLGNLYVASFDQKTGNSQVLRFDGKTGQYLDTFVSSSAKLGPIALGLTFGPQGDLFVASYSNDSVIRFSGANGAYLGDYVGGRSGGLRGPSGIVFDAAGYLYVGSTKGTLSPTSPDKPDSILRYAISSGNFDEVYVTPGLGGLDGPTALAFDAAGNLYVASDALENTFINAQVAGDSSQDNRILKYTPQKNSLGVTIGAFAGAFVARGAGELSGPSGLAFDAAGNLYVTSRLNDLVIKYNSSGTYVGKLDATPDIYGAVFGTDVNGDGIADLYVTAKDLDSVQIYDGHTGEYVRTFVPSRSGNLSSPKDLLFSPDGKILFVSSSANNLVNAYDGLTGKYLRNYGGGGLVNPDGMIIRNGLLYVAGTTSNNVAVFDLSSISTLPILTISGGGLSAPRAVSFDPLGNLLVTSSGTGNVLKFNPATGQYQGIYTHSATPGFTDPTTNKSQNDAFSNNVYIAWATNELGDLHDATVDQVSAIVLTGSSDGGGSFSPPQVLNDTRFKSALVLDAAPKITISQGRLPGTLSASDPGVPAGQVTVAWTDFGSNDYRTGSLPPTDAILADHVQAGVSYSTGVSFNSTDPLALIPASDDGSELSTNFALPVNVSDPRFTTVSHVSVRLSLIHPDVSLLQIVLIAPDGTRVPLVEGGAIGTGLGLQPLLPASSNGPFTIDTVFDDQAPRAIANTNYAAPYVGRFRPDNPSVNFDGKSIPGPGLSVLNGMTRAVANGIWKLEISDISGAGPVKLTDQRLLDWGIDLNSNMTDSKDVTVVAADYASTRLERYSVKGIDYTGPLLLSNNSPAPSLPGDPFFGGDPAGIAPAPVLASDNTLGSFSPYQGRIYMAYVDATAGYLRTVGTGTQPGDDTNIYLKYSDDGGLSWSKLPTLVNDDNGTTDGFSEADLSGGVDNGHPQFMPSIAVDASTGTLALSYYDTRYDPQHALTAMYVATSIDGGATYAPQTFVNAPQIVTDGITRLPVTLGPIPDNMSAFNAAQPGVGNGVPNVLEQGTGPGYGAGQGLAFVNGRLYPAWASNQNRGATGRDQLDIRVVAATVASGPRIVTSTMGTVTSQTVKALDGSSVTFNNQTATGVAGVSDGTPLANGFVVVFDRPVDPASFLTSAVTVTYRDVLTSGFAAGLNVPVNTITPLSEGSTPLGVTKFLVRFTPQGFTGTYSYQVGATIRDRIRTVNASGTLVLGNLMDQNGNAINGEDPRIAPVTGLYPGDVYADPTPAPSSATTFSGPVFAPPFDRTTQPLIVSGPHIVSTFVPGSTKTPDNLVTDKTVNQIAVVFDRDMDATTLNAAAVLRVVGPQGLVQGPFTITPQTGQGIHLRTFLIGFPVQQLSGTYTVTLASTVKSSIGELMDTNQNAGLDVLRGDPTGGTTLVTFKSNDSKAPTIGGSTPGRVTTSKITVTDNFVVQNLTLSVDITFPFDPELDARLIAPDGTSVQLFSNVGQTGLQANFSNTTFDDTANTPIQNGGPPFFGTFNPRFPLSAFKTHDSGGVWTLEVTDNGSGKTGSINSWTLNLLKPIPATGLGDPVADQATVSFRIFTQDPTNSLASNTWTAVGPAGIGAKGAGLNAEISGRIGAVAVDPSDPSGNTVYVSSSSGGIWKTQNFLTTSPTGPTYVPLTDFGPTFGINVGSIAVFARNNDPNQSIIIATTGDPDALGIQPNFPTASPAPSRGDSASLTSRGVGFLRSMDGGATWTLLDSMTNFDATGVLLPITSGLRDHVFVGTAGFKVAVDPKLTPDGQVIIYAALSDVDANGNRINGDGRAGGIWRSVDTGKTWTIMKHGQATDVILDLASGTGAPDGNLQILYAAFRGTNQGVFRSPNRGQEFDLMTGTAGDPLIQNFSPVLTQPVGVLSAAPSVENGLTTPNGDQGRIVLARPAVTGNALEDVLYQGWLYAAVVSSQSIVTADNQLVSGGHLGGLYLTKDFGQNWTRVQLPAFAGGASIVPSTDDRLGEYGPLGVATPYGYTLFPPPPPDLYNFGTGNFNISLAIDPNNPNVVYLGGSSQFSGPGLMRIDTTGVADPHAFYLAQNDPEGTAKTVALYAPGGERSVYSGFNPPVSQINVLHGPAVLSSPGGSLPVATNDPFDPYYTPFINLIANPRNPFLTASTILVTNTAGFTNTGAKAKWVAFDQALKPDTFSTDPLDPWSVPTTGVHRILTMVDPTTGKTRLIFGDDNGIFTAVDKGDGTLVGSLGSTTSLATAAGDVKIATGSRNGNLQTTQFYYGASEPSNVAAQVSLLKGMFYGSTAYGGTPYSNTNVINVGASGYGDITWDRPYTERSSGAGIAVVQTGPTYPGFGSFYRYVLPSTMDNLTGINPSVPTDFLQRDLTSRTFNLLQNTAGQLDPILGLPIVDIPDGQWPFEKGYNFTVNPLSGEQLLISSQNGTVFSTENQGKFWNVIGNPGALDSSNAQALAYGAPDTNTGTLGNLNSFLYAGTIKGNVFVTFNGGGANGNAWTNLSAGLDGSAIQQIITNPTRTSHEAYAVTQKGVYHMVDSTAGKSWVNITGNLFNLTATLFNDPTQVDKRLKNLTTVQADWRYIIPDDFSKPNGTTHPMLYVAGEGGVFRSANNGSSWSFFPSAATDPGSLDATPASPGDGGGLPNALVTQLNLVLGNIDPTNGRSDISTGPNTLYATTFGRGAFTIRLAPVVFGNTPTSPNVLHLSNTLPTVAPPGSSGSDTGLSTTDNITNLTQPYIEGLSEQSAFGSVVTISLYDMTDTTKAPVLVGTGQTDAAGKFSIQINAGVYKADGTTDGVKIIGIQATDQSGTKGNLTKFSFTLDTITPTKPLALILDPTNDTGRSNSDGNTQATKPIIDVTGTEPNALVFLYRDGGAKAVATRTGDGKVQDPGPLADGNHTYVVIQEDVAGNLSLPSDPLVITVDTTPPAAPLAPDLQDASDSGSSNIDNDTSVSKPFFNVTTTANESNDTVYLLRKKTTDSKYVVVGKTIGSGVIQDLTLPTVPDGVYNYATQQEDVAGNVGPISSPVLTVTIDTTPPVAPTVPDLEDKSDTGLSNTDNYTSDRQPFFDITSSEPNSVVQLLRKLASDPVSAYAIVGQASTVAALGVTIRDLGPLANGVYNFAAQVLDLAGNLGNRSSPLVVTIDTTAAVSPLALVLDSKSDSGSSNVDEITNVAAPFFDVTTGEPNQSVQLYRKAQGASDSTYVAVGSPIIVVSQGTGILQDPTAPANGVFVYSVLPTDAAGNLGSLGVVTTTVTFDNIPPDPPIAPDLTPATDSGVSNSDDFTNSVAPAFQITTTEATATIQLLRKKSTDPIGSFVVVSSIIGSGTVTDGKLPSPLPDGVYTYASRQVDVAGNIGLIGATLTVTIDTTSPAVPTLVLDPRDDTGTLGDSITSVLRPRLDGVTEPGASIVLLNALGGILATGTAGGDGSYILVPNQDLSPDGTYQLRVTGTDTAGNTSTSSILLLTIDTTSPGTPPAPQLDPASDSGQFNNDSVTNVKAPFFLVTATESGSTVQLYRKKQGDADSSYVLVGQALNGGKIQDQSIVNFTDGIFVYVAKQIDASGNVGSFGQTLAVSYDTTKPPTGPIPQLDRSSDSGVIGDGITNVKSNRLFNLTATELTATVGLYRKLVNSPDSSYVLVASIVGSGQVTDTAILPDTKYSYAEGQTDLAGNVGPLGALLVITIDTQPPTSPTINLVSADDSGSKGDAITSNKRPRFTGVTEVGASVELLSSGSPIATATADPSTGIFTLQTLSNLADGVYTITARATDVAGNQAVSLSTITLTIDSSPPAVPTVSLLPADDTGLVGDGITSVRRPHFVGVTEPRATIALIDTATNIVKATAIADSKNGTFSVQPTLDLTDGKYVFQIRASDVAANVSLSTPLGIQIVTAAPSTPTMTLLPADDSGVTGDSITNVNRPRFTGTAGANVTIALIDSVGTIYGSATTDAGGAFTVQPISPLADGSYSFMARSTDGGGVTSVSPALSLTIDTTAPAPPLLTLLAADDSGVKGDFITNNRRPRLTGKGEPNGVAALYGPDGTLLSAVNIAADGNFTLQPVSNLKVGPNLLSYRISDQAGNLSVVAAVPKLTIIKSPGDYDGDGKTDIAVYDSNAATFYVQYSGGGSKVFSLGVANGKGFAISGDYDGDGKTDFAAYDPNSATFYINYSSGIKPLQLGFGVPSHNTIPVGGDFDGDGRTDIAVYDPTAANYYIFYSASGVLASPKFGNANKGDLPVAGDFNGDGRTDLAVFEPGPANYLIVYSDGSGGASRQFGVPNGNDLPIAADFDGDGKTDLSVFDPKPAVFYELFSNGGSKVFQYGIQNGQGLGVSGDYDGDGKTDTTMFDPVSATFYATFSGGGAKVTQFGPAGHRNIPIPSVVPPVSLSGKFVTAGDNVAPAEFTPIVAPSATISGSTALGFAFGHPDQVKKFNLPTNRVKNRLVNISRHVVKAKATKLTPHDAAIESLWEGKGE